MLSLQRLLPVCGLLLASSPLIAATIIVSPPSQFVSSGAPVIVRIGFSNLGDLSPQALGAYDILLSYDPALMVLSSITHGDPVYGNQLDLAGYGTIAFDDTSTPGEVRLMEVSFDDASVLNSSQRRQFSLASLLFDTQGSGVVPLNVTVNMLGDAYGSPINAQAVGGSLSIGQSNVPEPAMFVLVGAGLAAIGILRRRRGR